MPGDQTLRSARVTALMCHSVRSRGELDPMFDELASIPAKPPRTGFLPGMRLSSAVPRSTVILLLAFTILFAVFPLSIMSTDPKAKLGIFPSRTTQGRVLSVTDVSGWRGSAARRVVYAFSAESGNEFRGAGGGRTAPSRGPISAMGRLGHVSGYKDVHNSGELPDTQRYYATRPSSASKTNSVTALVLWRRCD
jgi:hypothetical protein